MTLDTLFPQVGDRDIHWLRSTSRVRSGGPPGLQPPPIAWVIVIESTRP